MKVRFAPSPTGSLHIGNALGAVANRNAGGTMLLRIDDTDRVRNLPGGEEAILADLHWLGIEWDEGPIRQSERGARYREAAAGLPQRFQGVTLLRDDGSATYHLASVVDDIDFGITHVIRANEHRPNAELHRALTVALGAVPPEYVHYGLVLGPDGKKLSKRTAGMSIASLRDEGIPPEAVRAYLGELGIPKHDVQLDLSRIRSLAVDVLAALPEDELAARLGIPASVIPAVRGAHDLNEARELARSILEPPSISLPAERETLERFRELRGGVADVLDADAAKAIVRELKAIGGHLRAVRQALTGRESGPELWAVIAALPRDETLRRLDAAL
ncbi:MAG TPA: glutamate--tRNA ligase family protein [Gaiellaceae bacterium]|nr:glutamate--tRNA ligase family protein [Gaiellaceae bacterium]